MRFGLLGSVVQIYPGSEGYLLWQADLLDKGGEDWEVEIQPTDLLRSSSPPCPTWKSSIPFWSSSCCSTTTGASPASSTPKPPPDGWPSWASRRRG
jgi:hypothetical protein